MRPRQAARFAGVFLATIACLAGTPPATAAQGAAAGIRGADVAARRLMATAMDRSATIASLVRRVESSDVVVFLGFSLDEQFRGDVRLVGAGGGWRYVSVRVHALSSEDDQIVMLGHELQHIVEITEHPDVTDAASLERVMRQIGREFATSRRFETDAAVRIGQSVRAEVARWRAARR